MRWPATSRPPPGLLLRGAGVPASRGRDAAHQRRGRWLAVMADVLIVGAGPAGLAAARVLRLRGIERVVIADRELAAGGTPRHCVHTGFGARDLRRVMLGPEYARRCVQAAAAAGAEVSCATTVTSLALLPGGRQGGAAGPSAWQASLTSPAGIQTVTASAVLLATGCRERPRAARLVPGDRPGCGVLTTGELQQRVFVSSERMPGRALVVGAEHVSFSALLTLAHAGADVIALVTELPRHSSFAAFKFAAALRWSAPVWTSTVVERIIGRDRLTGVEVRDAETGAVRLVDCETLVFSADWIGDYELARMAGVHVDANSRGVVVDTALRASVPGLYAAGNLVHPAETADIAALGGRHAGRHIAEALREGREPPPGVPVLVDAPLAWIAPSAIAADRA